MDLMKDFDHRRGAGHIKDPEREIWQGVMVKVSNSAAGRREDCADGRQMEEESRIQLDSINIWTVSEEECHF